MGTTLAILYGVEMREEGDPVVDAVCAAMRHFSDNFMPPLGASPACMQ